MYSASPLLLSLLVLSSVTSSVLSFGIGGLKHFSKSKPDVSKPPLPPPPPTTTTTNTGSSTTSTFQYGPKITLIQNTQDYLDFIGLDDRLCVVKFYASWCKSCQKFGVLYKRLALQKGDIVDTSRSSSSSTSGNGSGDDEVLLKYGDVRFAEVEFSANAELCRTLGIKKLPNVHLYKGDLGRITGFPCGPSKFSLLEETLERFLTMTEDELKLEKTLEEGGELVDDIVTKLREEHYSNTPHSG